MTKPRSSLISLSDTPYYHCISRCVRRTFLCGHDSYSGESYEHRREWIVERLNILADMFCIDICAYAIMSNHYHLVLKVNQEKTSSLSDEDVIQRRQTLYKGPLLIQRLQQGASLTEAELLTIKETVNVWRYRLADISWFMRCINEHIAREANKEDRCKGRFWEGRFKSQALLDDAAILACMAYVDLNPIRAKLATTPETSDFTSVQARLNRGKNRCHKLAKFRGNESKQNSVGIPFSFRDYLKLVDQTGRTIRPDKRGKIPQNTSPILERLGLCPDSWLDMFNQVPRNTVFSVAHMKRSQAKRA